VRVLHGIVPTTAIALAGIFFGIVAYITLDEQPARLALAAGPMLAQWRSASRRESPYKVAWPS